MFYGNGVDMNEYCSFNFLAMAFGSFWYIVSMGDHFLIHYLLLTCFCIIYLQGPLFTSGLIPASAVYVSFAGKLALFDICTDCYV